LTESQPDLANKNYQDSQETIMESDLLFINDDVMLDIDNNQNFENDVVEKNSISTFGIEDSSLTSNNQHIATGPSKPFDYRPLTDFQRFIAHEDFQMFLLLATKVKIVHKDLASETVPQPFTLDNLQSTKGEDSVSKTARFIQVLLVFDSHPALIQNHSSILIRKGTFKSTDLMVTELIVSLTNEFDRCMTSYDAMKMKSVPIPPARKKRKTAKQQKRFEEKFPKWKQDILINWMIDNIVSICCCL
jgi:hypothetical protein